MTCYKSLILHKKFYKTKEITATQTSFSTNTGGKQSFILSFLSLLSASTTAAAATYIIFSLLLPVPTTIITLEPCALNAECQQIHTEI